MDMTTDIAPQSSNGGILPAVLGVNAVARYLSTNPKAIRRMLQTGELVGWRTAGPNRGDWRVSKAACDEWIATQEARGRLEVNQ